MERTEKSKIKRHGNTKPRIGKTPNSLTFETTHENLFISNAFNLY